MLQIVFILHLWPYSKAKVASFSIVKERKRFSPWTLTLPLKKRTLELHWNFTNFPLASLAKRFDLRNTLEAWVLLGIRARALWPSLLEGPRGMTRPRVRISSVPSVPPGWVMTSRTPRGAAGEEGGGARRRGCCSTREWGSWGTGTTRTLGICPGWLTTCRGARLGIVLAKEKYTHVRQMDIAYYMILYLLLQVITAFVLGIVQVKRKMDINYIYCTSQVLQS